MLKFLWKFSILSRKICLVMMWIDVFKPVKAFFNHKTSYLYSKLLCSSFFGKFVALNSVSLSWSHWWWYFIWSYSKVQIVCILVKQLFLRAANEWKLGKKDWFDGLLPLLQMRMIKNFLDVYLLVAPCAVNS